MDRTVETLLKHWGIPDLIEVFASEEIDFYSFLRLKPGSKNIEILIPKMGKRIKFEDNLKKFQNSIFKTQMISDNKENAIPPDIDITSRSVRPVNMKNTSNIMISETFSLKIDQNFNNREIVDNVHIENIGQNIDKEHVCLNDEGHIEQKEQNEKNRNIESETCDMDELQLLEAIHQLDIEKFLKETTTGLIILNHYKKYGQLNTQIRRKLADVVMTHLSIAIFKKPYPLKLKNIHIKELAFKVAVYFKEKVEIYYVPPLLEGKHQKISKGIFVDRYRNNRKDCMTSGLIINVRSKKSNSTAVSPVTDATYEMNIECLKMCEPHLQWLKHNREPWSDVVEHWEASRLARRRDMATWDGNVHLLFAKWPILKDPQGYTLIESDYAAQFGNVLSIYNEWPEFSRKIYTLMQTEIKDRIYVEQLDQINENISEEERNIRLLKLLPALCITTMRIRKGTRNIKPTITESLNSFILSVISPADLEYNIERQRNRAAALNLTLQPFIIFVGRDASSVNAYYVCIDNTLYKIESALKAIDVCYKCFFVLHACYPKESEQVWLLIQKCLYKMTTEYDTDMINTKVVSIEKEMYKM